MTTIIIVEDDSSVNLAVTRLLEAAGFDVRSFMSAGALLADARACDADCLLPQPQSLRGLSAGITGRSYSAGATAAIAVSASIEQPRRPTAMCPLGDAM